MKKQLTLIVAALVLLFSLGQAAWAFSDTGSDPHADKIEALRQAGVLAGDADGAFHPGGKLTYAQGVSLIVKALGLNIDAIRFFRAPQATDCFPNLKNDAWYSDAFIIACHNGLEVPKDVKADQPMTREQFAYHLFQGIQRTGEYMYIDLYTTFADEADVSKAYMDSIQKLLNTGVASLDKDKKFRPKAAITRGEAAAWTHDAIDFVNKNGGHTRHEEPAEPASPFMGLTMNVAPVNDKVNEVTVSAQVPNPGYGLRVESIVFEGDNAIVKVAPILPKLGVMYIQKITDVSATVYVSSAYKPVLVDTSATPEPGPDASIGRDGSGPVPPTSDPAAGS